MAVSQRTTTARTTRAAIVLNRQPRVARKPSSNSLRKIITKISDHRPLNLNKSQLARRKRKRQHSKSKEEVANRHQSKTRERTSSLSPKGPKQQNQLSKRRRKKLPPLKMPGVL